MLLKFFHFILERFNKKYWFFFLLVAVISILTNLFLLFIPLLQKKIIDSISITKLDYKSIYLVFIIGTLTVVLSICEALILNSTFMYIKNKLQVELLKSVMRKKNKIIEAKGPGAYMVSIFGDSEKIASLTSTNYFSILVLCVNNIIILFITFKWTWVFSAVVISSYLVMVIIIFITNKRYTIQFTKGREMVFEVNPKVLEFIENRETILNYSDINKYEENVNDIFKKRDSYYKSAFAADTFGKTAIDAIKNVSMLIFFILSMLEILNHKMELSSFIAMVAYFSQIFLPITAIQELNAGMNRFKTLKSKIDESLEIPVKTKLPKNENIIFENCTFSYSSSNDEKEEIQEAITNFDLNVNKKIGVVGLTGEGKTTIIKIMLGELEVKSGSCTFGEENILEISRFVLYSKIRLYSQNPEIFDDSLEFNITLGKKGLLNKDYISMYENYKNLLKSCFEKLTNKKDNKILKELNKEDREILTDLFMLTNTQLNENNILVDIINNLPNNIKSLIDSLASIILSRRYYIIEKYNSIVNELEIEYLNDRNLGQRGTKISGGEKNKICLARFLLPDNESIFIIDEPFTSLDILSENKCVEVLKKSIVNSKGIIISHKLNVINALSDEIIVLNNGRIMEKGTHESLLNNQSLYSKLFREYNKK